MRRLDLHVTLVALGQVDVDSEQQTILAVGDGIGQGGAGNIGVGATGGIAFLDERRCTFGRLNRWERRP